MTTNTTAERAEIQANVRTNPANVITLPKIAKSTPRAARQRFKVKEFINPSGDTAWRVDGYKRDGERIRENFPDVQSAQCRQIELETEFLRGHVETSIQPTKLTADQVRVAELAIIKLGDDWDRLLDCVDYWQRNGAKNIKTDAPKIDDAIGHESKPDSYLHWLKGSSLRDATKKHWNTRMTIFKNSVPNIRVSEMTPDFVEDFLSKLKVGAEGKDTYRRAISRFCSWCIERPRRWLVTNPCREVKIQKGEKPAPAVLSIKDCKALLKAAVKHEKGILVPYVAVGLFGGLRPFEASRLTWAAVNLKDNEIRLEAAQTKTGRKTGRGRVVAICPTLKRWLEEYKNVPFYPANWRKEFDAVKAKAGFGPQVLKVKDENGKMVEKKTGLKPWPDDVLRHTAISHHFRLHQSYGKAAEQFGNSEAIIKAHYQGRVTSDDTKKFYALRP